MPLPHASIYPALKKVAGEQKADWNRTLWRLTTYLNFNQREVLVYSSEKVRSIALSNEPYLAMQEKLLTLLKEVKQMEEIHGFM